MKGAMSFQLKKHLEQIDMKTETVKIYRCGYCKKYTLSGSSTSRHEKYCRYNPANKHICFAMCIHLQRKRVIDKPYSYNHTVFTCGLTGQEMYSYQLEKKQSLWPFHKILRGIRMPMKCDVYKEMTEDQICNRFGI
jgi:hypothetical protein